MVEAIEEKSSKVDELESRLLGMMQQLKIVSLHKLKNIKLKYSL